MSRFKAVDAATEVEAYYEEHPDERPVEWPRYILCNDGYVLVVRFAKPGDRGMWFSQAGSHEDSPDPPMRLEELMENSMRRRREVALREAVEALYPHRDVWLGGDDPQYVWRIGREARIVIVNTENGNEYGMSRSIDECISFEADRCRNPLRLLTEAEAKARIKKPAPEPGPGVADVESIQGGEGPVRVPAPVIGPREAACIAQQPAGTGAICEEPEHDAGAELRVAIVEFGRANAVLVALHMIGNPKHKEIKEAESKCSEAVERLALAIEAANKEKK